jgi:hypothetical protein
MPSVEFWFTGIAFWAAAGFLFTGILAVIAVEKRVGALLALPIVTLGLWYGAAQGESDKAKPSRDFVYFALAADNPTNNDGNGVVLESIATGPLRDVNVAIQTAEQRDTGSGNYVTAFRIPVVNEDEAPVIKIPVGDYWIDSDPPTRMGKVLEHLQIERAGDKVFQTSIFVMRKATRQTLIPESPSFSLLETLFLSLTLFSFIGFSAALLWASQISSPGKKA